MSVEIIKNGDPFKGSDDGIEKGVLELCIRVTAQAKSLAPVDKALLRNSIMYITFLKESSPGEGPRLTQIAKKFEGYVGSAVDYSIYQEFGTRNTAAQPYMRPAVAIEARGAKAQNILAKIQIETMRGALKKGQKRSTFGVR